jgi:uncharacterized cupredoxin-like copper-binding protein
MLKIRNAALALVIGSLPLVVSSEAIAATTITVSLWDKGDHAMDMLDQAKPMGMGMMHKMMMSGDMKMGPLGISASATEVPAGEVTFAVTNDSKSMIHEMVLSLVKDANAELPYITDEMRVDEDAAGHLGEVAELDPGKSGELTLTLEPGTYLLFCNLPGHYALGMWTLITVTP